MTIVNSLNNESSCMFLGDFSSGSPDPTNYLCKLIKNQNSTTATSISNSNSGSASAAGILLQSDSCATTISCLSSTWSTANLQTSFFINVQPGNCIFQLQSGYQFRVTSSGAMVDLFYIDYTSGQTVINTFSANSAQLCWSVSKSIGWCAGIDTADSNTWKLASGSDITANNKIRISSSGCEVLGYTGTIPTGYNGELQLASLNGGSPITLTTATTANVCSFTLSPGNWLISGDVCFQGTLTGTATIAGISLTSATLGAQGSFGQLPIVPTATSNLIVTTPQLHVQSGSPFTVYLVSQAVFSMGTATAFGNMVAVRIG